MDPRRARAPPRGAPPCLTRCHLHRYVPRRWRWPRASRRRRIPGGRADDDGLAALRIGGGQDRGDVAYFTANGGRVRSLTARPPPATTASRPCAAMPDSPAASRSANGSSAAFQRGPTPFRDGLLAGSDPAAPPALPDSLRPLGSPDTGRDAVSSRAAGTGSAGCSSCPPWSRSSTIPT